MPVQAVVFDAMGTVIEPDPPVALVYQAALKKHCRLDLAENDIHSALRSALSGRSAGDDLSTSEEAEAAFWDRFIRELAGAVPGRAACFDELFDHFAKSANWKCFHDVPETVAELSRRGLILGIASNFDLRLHAVLDGIPPLQSIAHRVVSSEAGWRKPSSRFFNAVCRQLGLPAEDVLVVGDDLVNDVVGAQQAGCKAAWICRSASSRGSSGQPSSVQAAPDGTIILSKLTDLPDRIATER